MIERAVAARVQSIEWGSDVHLPAGDIALATRVGEATRAAGIEVCSYGSYIRFPWAQGPAESIEPVIESARALGAPRIRIWAGPSDSAKADAVSRAATTAELVRMAELAAEASIELAVEFHSGTLADTAASTLQLLDELPSNVSTYWQPRVGAPDAAALDDLDALAARVSTAHAFSWGAAFDRHLLATRPGLWSQAFERIVRLPKVTDVLVEFLPGDDPALLDSEVHQLEDWRFAAREGNS
ncbi:sugar phosphate isomerase/epimerase family protein [Leifsonia sp. 2MCAF36]|uniref:sugar phosphate isomerase/epimerase family protein n=1 Tax=Leifsonia sp. 2MCAF36 TaxID=3232988 RepID=UPI003F96B4D9